ncbi:MAG: protein kinase [Blastocatellia bacterium]|nr:protein kinase [Blastocatellia bacterium]
MTPERYNEVGRLYRAAMEVAPAQRAAFLAAACGEDDALRQEVQSLLGYAERPDDLLDHPALDAAARTFAKESAESLVGQRLGQYQILSLLGKGGMGEVYRARHMQLGREAAIKVLPAEYAENVDRLRRFEQEARAAGMLNHPNVLTIYDIGSHAGAPYLVAELLEGETLRERTRCGALTPHRAVGYALQVARGLAAAHEKGIVHRDLKPENLFVTQDGRVKILDFGLAKLTQSLSRGDADASTHPHRTASGMILGTIGYMSPEQVRAEEVDHRSDLFAFGAILYEMLAGRAAFRGSSAVETMSAILNAEPRLVSLICRRVSPALERLVRRCLGKNIEERFQSARDLAFALEELSSADASSGAALARTSEPSGRRPWLLPASALLIAATMLAAFFVGRPAEQMPPEFQRLTFHRGAVTAARFAPDGQTIIYSARWQGEQQQLYSTRPESPESRPLGLDAELLAISPVGELAIALQPSGFGLGIRGTLAQMPIAGSAPRPILQNVSAADWAADGKRLAIAREVNGRYHLEFPSGTTLHETAYAIERLRISPQGDWIAFEERGAIEAINLTGKRKTLSSGWNAVTGLAWSPDGNEVWFTAAKVGFNSTLHSITLSGRQRVVTRLPHQLRLFDISRDGRVLLASVNVRKGIRCLPPGDSQERDLSWFDWGHVADISDDGRLFLFSEAGEGGGAGQTVYLRKTDGSPPIRLGEGVAYGLSPKGDWALTIRRNSAPSGPLSQVILLPTGPGEAKVLADSRINWQRAIWFPDGKHILASGVEPGRRVRGYVLDIEGGEPRPITREGLTGRLISPDGQWLIAVDARQTLAHLSVAGGEPQPVPGQVAGDEPIQWSANGRSIYVRQDAPDPKFKRIYRLELTTGRRELWKEQLIADPVRIAQSLPMAMTPDGKSYAYTYIRGIFDLYLIRGLK